MLFVENFIKWRRECVDGKQRCFGGLQTAAKCDVCAHCESILPRISTSIIEVLRSWYARSGLIVILVAEMGQAPDHESPRISDTVVESAESPKRGSKFSHGHGMAICILDSWRGTGA